jgi:hypothetical protein
MNPIQQLLREQKEEFERKFGADIGEYGMEKIEQHNTTAQQQLIDVIIEGMKKSKSEYDGCDYTSDYRIAEMLQDANDNALQTQITLLEEAKKNI